MLGVPFVFLFNFIFLFFLGKFNFLFFGIDSKNTRVSTNIFNEKGNEPRTGSHVGGNQTNASKGNAILAYCGG